MRGAITPTHEFPTAEIRVPPRKATHKGEAKLRQTARESRRNADG